MRYRGVARNFLGIQSFHRSADKLCMYMFTRSIMYFYYLIEVERNNGDLPMVESAKNHLKVQVERAPCLLLQGRRAHVAESPALPKNRCEVPGTYSRC